MIERLPHDERFDRLVVDGELVGYAFRELWDLGDGPPLHLGNTETGHTVAGASTDDLVDRLIEKRDEVRRHRGQ